MDDDRARSTLQLIALTLGMPDDAFRDQVSSSQDLSGAPVDVQAAELLTLFSTIADPKARQSCLAYVREAAKGTGKSGI